MNLGVIPVLFGLLVIAAGVTDFFTQRIPNWLVLVLAGSFVVQALLHLREVDWVSHLVAAGLCLGVGMLLFSLGQLGAGDAKLVASVALWSGLYSLIRLMFFTSLAGLLLLLILLGARRAVSAHGIAGDRLPKSLLAGQGVPFGVAIAVGTLATMAGYPSWLWSL